MDTDEPGITTRVACAADLDTLDRFQQDVVDAERPGSCTRARRTSG